MTDALSRFKQVFLVDFEYSVVDGGQPVEICMVAAEWRTGATRRFWQTELREFSTPPIELSDETLFVAYFASAEFGCFLALGWARPPNVLDLFVEFRNSTNGLTLPTGNSLLGALAFHGLPFMTGEEKDSMRALALRGGPWTIEEQGMLLAYCESDVRALGLLLGSMVDSLDVERALLRGRQMWSVAEMERRGIPIDVSMLALLRDNWDEVRAQLVRDLDEKFNVFEGGSFRLAKLREFLVAHGIEWPEDQHGRLVVNDAVVKAQALRYPQLAALRVGRQALAQLKPPTLPVGADRRSRSMLSPFSSKTGRNQPRTKNFVFGWPSWFRRLVAPDLGQSIAYIDWEQQEFGIAAALSGDVAMLAAYESGDPYLDFARQAGAVPQGATKDSHAGQRELYKQCALGVIYGMTPVGLAARIGQPLEGARQLLRTHQNTFPDFWDWSDAIVYSARTTGRLVSTFGWQQLVTDATNDRSLRNYPMQANGAEMLRLAIMFAQDEGVAVCAPVHDAILIEAATVQISSAVEIASAAMAEASALVLGGLRLRTEAEIVDGPNHFPGRDPAGIWALVSRAAAERRSGNP
ncbi:MAG TPA: DNA polymerase [Polyangiaceae bacterium]|nr:DNA polymerase [Polyangiaceae bacterium]